jgi:8-oxo-dGTP diphosphatase
LMCRRWSGSVSSTKASGGEPSPGWSGPLLCAKVSIVEVAAGLIFRRGRVLITQRKGHDHLAGLWEFPGGKREPAETFPECLCRELREELGIDVEVGELIESLVHHYPDKTVHLEFYRCVLVRNNPQPLGCQALAWVTAEELSRYDFPPADARLLARLRKASDLWGHALGP